VIDVTSVTWRTIEAWLEGELDGARRSNDRPMPEADTAALRGRIAALIDLQGLPARIKRDTALLEEGSARPIEPTYMTQADY
jgi:hypothetical protein